MAKIKVHELAKELELQSKDILSFLQEKGIEAKAAQSSLEEDAAALVRNSLGKKKAAAPAAEKKAPAKKAAASGVTIKLVKSLIGRSVNQIATAKSLGLKKVGDITVQPDNTATNGKINKISHMVEVTKA